MSKYVTVKPIWEWEEETRKRLAKIANKKFLVVTDGSCQQECNVYSFDGLLKEFWLELYIKGTMVGVWQTDCDDWLIQPTKITSNNNLQSFLHQFLEEIVQANSLDVLAIACVKNKNFVATI